MWLVKKKGTELKEDFVMKKTWKKSLKTKVSLKKRKRKKRNNSIAIYISCTRYTKEQTYRYKEQRK